jgi:hypothetical protein
MHLPEMIVEVQVEQRAVHIEQHRVDPVPVQDLWRHIRPSLDIPLRRRMRRRVCRGFQLNLAYALTRHAQMGRQFLQRRHLLVVETETALDHPAMFVAEFRQPGLHMVFQLGHLQHVLRPFGMFVGNRFTNRQSRINIERRIQ